MSRIKGFLHKVKSSVYGPDFYLGAKGEPFKRPLYYFFLITLLSVLITPGLLALFTFFSKTEIQDAVSMYPSELSITIEGGKASTNMQEPIFIPSSETSGPKNWLVVDTQNDFSAVQFTEYSTFALLKKDFIVTSSKPGDMRIVPLTAFNGQTFTQERLQGWADTISRYIVLINALFGLSILLIVFAVTIVFNLAYLLVMSLVAMLLGKVLKYALTYKEAYKIALYAITAPILVELILRFVGASLPAMTFSALMIIVMFANMYPKRGATQVVPTGSQAAAL